MRKVTWLHFEIHLFTGLCIVKEEYDLPHQVWHCADADFLAFKQQIEGEPDMLPSAEVQLDVKEQEKKAALLSGMHLPSASKKCVAAPVH